MGWRISETGFEIVLSPAVPTIAEECLAPGVDAFLSEHSLARADVSTWVCHPGGPKVLSAMQAGLGSYSASVSDTRRAGARLREVERSAADVRPLDSRHQGRAQLLL